MITLALRRAFGTMLAGLALATAACGGDDSAGPSAPADITGTYALSQVRALGNLGGGGSGLPVTFIGGGGSTLTFESGTLTLSADGSYTLSVDAEFNGNSVQMTDEGSYSRAGVDIDFEPASTPARMDSGRLTGNKVTARSQFGGIPFEIDLQK